VFPLKKELLHPEAEMERHITDLIKKVIELALNYARFYFAVLDLLFPLSRSKLCFW
jgi:hypothetical protein